MNIKVIRVGKLYTYQNSKAAYLRKILKLLNYFNWYDNCLFANDFRDPAWSGGEKRLKLDTLGTIMVDKSILQWGRIALLGAAGSLAALTGWTTPAKADIIIHFTGTTDSGTNDTANYFGGITGIQTVNGVLTISPDGLTDACGGGGSCFRSGTNINSSWTINGITVSTSSAGTVNGLVGIYDTSTAGGGFNNFWVSTTDETITENLGTGFNRPVAKVASPACDERLSLAK